jgi:hypothetical protein
MGTSFTGTEIHTSRVFFSSIKSRKLDVVELFGVFLAIL